MFFYGLLLMYSFMHLKKLLNQHTELFLFFLTCFGFESLTFLLNKFSNSTAQVKIYDHMYLITEIVLVSIFYLKLQSSINFKKIITIATVILVVVGFVLMLTNKGYLSSPDITPVKNAFFTILGLITYNQLSKSNRIKVLSNNPIYFFNLGFLLVNFLYFVLMPLFYYTQDVSDDLAFIVGTIKNLTEPIATIIWALGIIKLQANTKPIAFQ